MDYRTLIFTLLMSIFISGISSKIVRIGCLVSSNYVQTEEVYALQNAVEYVNSRQLLGPGNTLEYLCNSTKAQTFFEMLQLGCYQSEVGVMAFVVLAGSGAQKIFAPLSEALKIPQITPTATNPMLASKRTFPYILRLSAPDSVQGEALVNLVEHFGWDQLAILTSNTDYGINGLLQFHSEAAKRGWKVVSVQQFVVTNDATLNATRELTVIKETGVRIILLNCELPHAKVVLQQAKEANMTGAGWAWIATDGITGSSELATAPVPDHYRGILGTTPTVGRGALYQDFLSFCRNLDPVNYPGAGPGTRLSAYGGLTVDTILAFSYAVRNMYNDPGNEGVTQTAIECGANHVWENGSTMLHYMSTVDGDGVNNRINFNQMDGPEVSEFDIVNLNGDGWLPVGHWDNIRKLKFTNRSKIHFHGNQQIVTDYVSNLATKHLIVVTKVEEPFVMFTKPEPEDLNDIKDHEIEGFCIDILKNLSSRIGFTYTLKRSDDNEWGIKNNITRKWNGMARELVDRNVDMIASSYTINKMRELDFDFTTPYVDLGMKLLMKADISEAPEPFRFLNPFSKDVYYYIILTTVLVSIYTSILNKLSPYDYHGGFVYNKKPNPRSVKGEREFNKHKYNSSRTLSFMNSCWLSIGSLLHQGGAEYPRSLAARITTVMWWMGIVIIIQTYTANLAAFFTTGRLNTDINSVEDLGGQNKVIYGTIQGASPHQYFMDSNITLYRLMQEFMETSGGLMQDTKDAVERARKGNYVFIWDDIVLNSFVQSKPCNTLKTVGRLFGKIGYGFALQKNSPYKHELSTHILQLREIGFMDELKKKWFEDRTECFGESTGESEADAALAAAGGRMGINHMLGVFLIIYTGLALSFAVLIIEWIIASIAIVGKYEGTATFKDAVMLRFKVLYQDMKEDWCPNIPYFFSRTLRHTVSQQDRLNELNKEYRQIQFKSRLSVRSSFDKAMLSMTRTKSPTWNAHSMVITSMSAPPVTDTTRSVFFQPDLALSPMESLKTEKQRDFILDSKYDNTETFWSNGCKQTDMTVHKSLPDLSREPLRSPPSLDRLKCESTSFHTNTSGTLLSSANHDKKQSSAVWRYLTFIRNINKIEPLHE
ncbi:unnamed protein product [Owenia fusiformis]|uniref:Uncharacterized protein n=1 Tax=Owenia fusiformis TaxID=6347 RepID=A0A8J1XRY6_OWEFU|nr:unnamed protein product [Owenia fusiformis]